MSRQLRPTRGGAQAVSTDRLLSRRRFATGLAAGGAGLALAGSAGRQLANAQESGGGSLRGAAPRAPSFSVCGFTTLAQSFENDLAVYRMAGIEGIGITEFKLPEGQDAEMAALLRESGLRATICIPAVNSVLPNLLPGPEDPAERVDAIVSGIRRLAQFEPAAVLVLTGAPGDRVPEEARAIAVDGLRTAARTAAEVGVPIGLEAIHSSIRDDWSLVSDIPAALDLIAEVGEPNLGIMFDTWHLWDTPNLLDHIRQHAGTFVAVHVNDWRDPTRGWADRVLPGDGVIDLPAIFRALEEGGYDGWYDLEIFSDDGTFGSDYPDSLYELAPIDLVRRGREGFIRAWIDRGAAATYSATPVAG